MSGLHSIWTMLSKGYSSSYLAWCGVLPSMASVCRHGFSTLKTGGYPVGTPWDPLLGGVQGRKGLHGLPRFPGLGSSPRGPVAQTGPPKGKRRANFGSRMRAATPIPTREDPWGAKRERLPCAHGTSGGAKFPLGR